VPIGNRYNDGYHSVSKRLPTTKDSQKTKTVNTKNKLFKWQTAEILID